MSRKITIKFSDDNGDPTGQPSDSDNTGYRIYRAVGSDPSNTPAKKIYDSEESNNPPPLGTGEITFEDTSVDFNQPYYYRVENFRTKSGGGEDTALSPLVGPISIQDLDRLGYPNNTPSDQDGIATYSISVEPLIHYDASQEVKRHGIDHNYGAYNGTVENLSSRFSGADMVFRGGGLHLGIDGLTPEFRACEDNSSDATTLSIWNGKLFNQQIRDKIGIDAHVESRVVLDEGVCFFYIAPSVYNHNSIISSHKHVQHWGNASGNATSIIMRNVYPGRQSGFKSYKGDDYILKNHLPIKFSDGSNWTDPEPWAGSTVNPKDPGWFPIWQNHLQKFQTCFGFGHSQGPSKLEVNPNIGDMNATRFFGVSNGYGYSPLTYYYNYGGNYSHIPISRYPDINYGTWDDAQSKYTSCKINVFCKRIYPNGSYDFFINGVKAGSTKQIMFKTSISPPMPIPEEHIHKSFLQDFEGGINSSNRPSNVLTGTWWTEEPNRTNYDVSQDPLYYRPIEPWYSAGFDKSVYGVTYPYRYLMVTHPPSFGLNVNGSTGLGNGSYWTISSGAKNVFNELLLIPSDLTANSGADFNTMIEYINNKYGSSPMFATQGDYLDLPEQTITWTDDLSEIGDPGRNLALFEFTASSDQQDATIVYTLSSTELGTVSGNVFTSSSSSSNDPVTVTATALATSTHAQTSVSKQLTLNSQ